MRQGVIPQLVVTMLLSICLVPCQQLPCLNTAAKVHYSMQMGLLGNLDSIYKCGEVSLWFSTRFFFEPKTVAAMLTIKTLRADCDHTKKWLYMYLPSLSHVILGEKDIEADLKRSQKQPSKIEKAMIQETKLEMRMKQGKLERSVLHLLKYHTNTC